MNNIQQPAILPKALPTNYQFFTFGAKSPHELSVLRVAPETTRSASGFDLDGARVGSGGRARIVFGDKSCVGVDGNYGMNGMSFESGSTDISRPLFHLP
jgi:hypothetical protein